MVPAPVIRRPTLRTRAKAATSPTVRTPPVKIISTSTGRDRRRANSLLSSLSAKRMGRGTTRRVVEGQDGLGPSTSYAGPPPHRQKRQGGKVKCSLSVLDFFALFRYNRALSRKVGTDPGSLTSFARRHRIPANGSSASCEWQLRTLRLLPPGRQSERDRQCRQFRAKVRAEWQPLLSLLSGESDGRMATVNFATFTAKAMVGT